MSSNLFLIYVCHKRMFHDSSTNIFAKTWEWINEPIIWCICHLCIKTICHEHNITIQVLDLMEVKLNKLKLSKGKLEDNFLPHIDKYRRIPYEVILNAANTQLTVCLQIELYNFFSWLLLYSLWYIFHLNKQIGELYTGIGQMGKEMENTVTIFTKINLKTSKTNGNF